MATTAGTAMRWLRFGVAQAQTAAAATLDRVTPRSTPSPKTPLAAQPPDVSRFAPGGDQFVQPDQTTCGSSSLVMAKMINTPVYGDGVLAPGDDGSIDLAAVKARFAEAVLAMHRTTGGWKDTSGAWQLPWPTQLGTPPWAVARQLTVGGGSGRPGVKYQAHLANPRALGETYDAITAAVDGGDCVALFIGDDIMARHVVLVTGRDDADGLSIYDPSSGEWVSASRSDYVGGNISVAGWSQPWFVVTPG
jgi:hypothetical protein